MKTVPRVQQKKIYREIGPQPTSSLWAVFWAVIELSELGVGVWVILWSVPAILVAVILSFFGVR
jgi:hypothetical protein